MAKKDNHDEFDENDNLNREQNDFNDDDNFGLPDLEYSPIEDAKEEDQDPSKEGTYQSAEYYNEEDTVYPSESDDQEPPKESAYIPGSYVPPKDNSAVGKVIGIILVVILAGVGIWYFGFHQPQKKAEERARIEKQERMKRQKEREAAELAERERLALEQAQREEQTRLAAETKPKTGTIETISSRTGRYYVVIASAIDEDLAMDYAKKLSKEGISTSIIEPYGNVKFHRIAVENHDTWASAQNRANELKAEYGEGVWVKKY